MVSNINPNVRTLNNSSKIGFKANSNLLVQPPSSHPGWKEPTLLQRIKYPIATVAFVTGLTTLSVPSSSLPVKLAEIALTGTPIVSVLVDNKNKKTQPPGKHETSHFLIASARKDQVVPFGIEHLKEGEGIFLMPINEEYSSKDSTLEGHLSFLIGEALTYDAPYAVAELQGEKSDDFLAPEELLGDPKNLYQIAKGYIKNPKKACEILASDDRAKVVQNCWEAAAITSGNSGVSIERVKDFCGIYSKVRPTSKALIKSYDPQAIDKIADNISQPGEFLLAEDIEQIVPPEELYHNMPELSPQLKAKLLQGKQ